MQKSLSVAVFLCGLSFGAQAEAGDRWHGNLNNNLPSEIQSRSTSSLNVANLSPDSVPEMAVAPTNIVNINVQAIDPAKIVPAATQLTKAQPALSASAGDNTPGAIPPSSSDSQPAGKSRTISAAEQAMLRNYAPFMRNMVMAADRLSAAPVKINAARVMRGGKQVIVFGGP